MEEKMQRLENNCGFAGIRPMILDLPYPAIRVEGKNPVYANLLSMDYCGPVSEMSAITQYINNENRLSGEMCTLAKTILGIAVAEMMHLQKLGELIILLGGTVDFVAKGQNGRARMWTPEYLTIPEHAKKMLAADIEAEKAAVKQYKMHRNAIRDHHVNAVIERIIQDEEYHIMVLGILLGSL